MRLASGRDAEWSWRWTGDVVVWSLKDGSRIYGEITLKENGLFYCWVMPNGGAGPVDPKMRLCGHNLTTFEQSQDLVIGDLRKAGILRTRP
jgi:hypothetical protein